MQPITFPADNVHGTVFQIDNKHSRTSATTFLRQRFLEAATTSRSRQTRSTEPLREQRTWHTTNRVSFTHTNSASSVFHGDAGATGQGVSFFCLTFRFVSLHSPFFLSFFFLSFFFCSLCAVILIPNNRNGLQRRLSLLRSPSVADIRIRSWIYFRSYCRWEETSFFLLLLLSLNCVFVK